MKNLILVILFAMASAANAQAYFKGGNLIVSPTGKAGIGTTSPQVILDIQGTTTSTSSILLPRGTTANRHAGVNGMLRYNTSTSVFEGYSNGSWSTLGSGGGSGTVTSIFTSTGIVPNTITGTGTLSVDVGTTSSKIVQLTSGAQMPAVDGFLLSNLNVPKNDSFVAYTPTISNCGSASGISFVSRRNGPNLELMGTFVCTTPAAGLCQVSLGYNGVNGGLAIANAITWMGTFGPWIKNQASAGTAAAANMIGTAADTGIFFGYSDAGNAGMTKQNCNAIIAGGSAFSIHAWVPIQGW